MMQQRLKQQQALIQQSLLSSRSSSTPSGHLNIFVGDLSPEVTDATLYASFSVYPSCSDAKVMWDQKSGRSRGFGFVSFRNQQDAQSAINDLNGKWLGSRQIRCNWAPKGAGGIDDKQSSDGKSVVELTTGTSDDGHDKTKEDAPENSTQYTTVYVSNLSPQVSLVDLHRHFYALGAGVIDDVCIHQDKGFGFVRYSTHAEAVQAIQLGNVQFLFGKPIKRSWGSKPTFPGASCTPGISVTDLAAYERQLALGSRALMHSQGQGIGVASQAIYDGSYGSTAATTQPPMYY